MKTPEIVQKYNFGKSVSLVIITGKKFTFIDKTRLFEIFLTN